MSRFSALYNLMNGKLLVSFAVLAVGWYLNGPVPRGFSSPVKFRINMAVFKAMMTTLWILHYLRIVPYEISMRKVLKPKRVRVPDRLATEELTFDGVKVRLYKPKEAGQDPQGHPGLIYIHGGGWIVGSPSMYDQFILDVLKKLDLVVVSIDYRLAPEYPFPVPFEDCVNAAKYFLTNAASFGVNSQKVALAGDSAGGNLAAAVCLKLRDDDFSPMPKNQLLLYPALQAMDFSLPSVIQNKPGPLLTGTMMAYMWSSYAAGSGKYASNFLKNNHTTPEVKRRIASSCIRHENVSANNRVKPYRPPRMDNGDARVWNELKDTLENPYFAPLMAKDLSRLPDAYIFTAQYDMLRDEGELYAKRLVEAGVNVVYVNGDKGFHGMVMTKRLYPESQESFDACLEYLQNKFL